MNWTRVVLDGLAMCVVFNVSTALLWTLEPGAFSQMMPNEKNRELCGFTRQQARTTLDKMQTERILRLEGKERAARYYENKCVFLSGNALKIT